MRIPCRPGEVAPGMESGNDGGVNAAEAGDGLLGLSADILIPGRGEPVNKGAIVVEDGKIAWVGRIQDRPSGYSRVKFTHVPVLMPGLWDVHTHFMGSDVVAPLTAGGAEFMPGYSTLVGAVTVDDLKETLMAGFTTVRELGGMAGEVYPAVAMGRIPGPNVYSAYAVLSITGGHGDRHDVPLETVMDFCSHSRGVNGVCDGVEGVTRMVRQTIRRGAKVIKICSTGGVLSLNDQPEDSQFSDAELRAIVEEAARSSRSVASHAIGRSGILAALRAGVKSIEHGMYLDEEVAALMKERDAILVPTRHIVESLALTRDSLPPILRTKMERMLELSRSSLRLAVREGVKVALGTDTFSSDRASIISHGTNARELHWAVEAGMTPLQAIEMGTATPPETLGKMAPLSGQLKAGYDADIIAVARSPLEDIDVLTRPANITHVWKAGKLYKSPAP